ncbi:MAG: 2-hydroxychromene-2-carboxylate isomerase [Salaquimonas sp.]|jgi:2-hydroxychromene-2-carboxylate isomerase|nr:2-hydroxychromene-2-carboxylate isomerase [Salaquimonas sp.]
MPKAKTNKSAKPAIIFWFDPASTYSYLSAMRVDEVAAASGVTVDWRPFLLGPVFKAQGMDTSPFNLFPLKGRYMWRDMQRQCARLSIPFAMPDEAALLDFPRNSLLAARAATVALAEPWGRDFVRAVYALEFAGSRDIADPQVVAVAVEMAGGNPNSILKKATEDPVKAELRANTEKAYELGLFGAPSFTVGEEIFWGNDRLEQAVEFAREKVS